MFGLGFERVTADNLLFPGPCLLGGLVLLVSVTGGDVSLYNGNDAQSGALIGTFKGEANISEPIIFPWPLRCERGLYVDVGSNVTELLVFYKPARLDGSNPNYEGPRSDAALAR